MHDQRVEHRRPFGQAELGGHGGTGALLAGQVDFRVVAVPAVVDLFVQVPDREGGRHPQQMRRVGAQALHPGDQAFVLQFAQGTRDRHAADAELRHELGLGGHQGAGLPVP